MKPDWLIVDVTPAGSPDRAERAILGMMLGVFVQFRAFFGLFRPLLWSGEPLCDVGTPS